MKVHPLRIKLFWGGVILFVLALLVRVGYLQIYKHEFFKNKSEEQLKRVIRLYPNRGQIYDRNKKPLAITQSRYSAYAVPTKIQNKWDYAHLVAPYLKTTRGKLLEKFNKSKASFIWLDRHCTKEQKDALEKLGLEGLGFFKTQKRVYPHQTLSSQVLGYVGVDNQGLGGLDYYYDQFLKGSSGKIILEGDPRGFQLLSGKRQTILPQDGGNIVTTLDEYIQYSATKHLAKGIEINEAKGGYVIVMNPKTGEVLAMTSSPNFNGNRWHKSSYRARKVACINDVYEPGSVFKVLTIASAIEEQVVTEGTVLTVPETLNLYGSTINEAHRRKEDESDQKSVSEILQESLNVGVTLIATELGEPRFYKYIQSFGFGKHTGISLPGESRGLSRHYKQWSKVDIGMISFGQGIAVTPLQMAAAISSIANHGLFMKPKIINYLTDAQFRTRKGIPITKVTRVVSQETAQKVIDMMVRTVDHGTGVTVKIPGYQIAGKTGTAQKAKENGLGYERGSYMASFAGFFPAEDPQYLILVIVDRPQKSIWGSTVAGPIFKSITQDIIRYKNIAPSRPI